MRLLFALTLCLPALALCEDMEYTISLLGKEVGSCKTTLHADGAFESTANADLGPQKIKSHLIIRVEKGKLTYSKIDESANANSGIVTWDKGKYSVVANGKEAAKYKPLKVDSQAVFTTFHPAIAGLIYREFVAKNRPAKIKTFRVDSLSWAEMDSSESPAVVETPAGRLAITNFKLRAGGIELIYVIDAQQRVLGFSVPVQQFQMVAKGYEGVFVDPLSRYPELSQPTYKVKTETRVAMKTRDGVTLRSDIVRPDDGEKHPTILVRTPYGRTAVITGYEWLARRGYVVMSQDVRGRGASDGEWDPLNHEVADGDDTLNWIAAQPWSDGSAGMIGGSYLGFVQWAAAVNHNPVLKCIIPQVSPPDPMHNLPWENGAFMLTPGLWWARIVMERQANMAAAGQGISNFKPFLTLPVSQVDNKMFGKNVPFFDLWLKRPRLADWPGSFRHDQIKDVKIPVMHVSGLWDGDGIGTKMHWEALREHGGNQWLVFGPWEHGFNLKTKFGDQDYGSTSVLELDSVYLRFFDTFLKNKSVSIDSQPRVRFFVTGANKWAETTTWPPSNSNESVLYLAGGKASGPKSSGVLSPKPGAGRDTMVYEPMKLKVPEKGFEVDSAAAITTVKKADFRPSDLTYLSAPFASPTSVTDLVADLAMSTTARDSNIHVTVFDVGPDGKYTAIAMGGNGTMAVLGNGGKAVTPNKVYRVKLSPWYFARTFGSGHRLALRITTDLFPQFARNPGTGESIGSATKYLKATTTIHKEGSSIRFKTFSL